MTARNTWKKVLALLMALTIFCLPLASCQNGEVKDGESSETSSKTESVEEAGTLRVVTDLACRGEMVGVPANTSQGQQAFKDILKYFGGTSSGIKVELDILPTDKSGAYDAELTRIRTEIAAGGGPDVFLMSCFGLYPSFTKCLFLNPESAMDRGLFLPLDEYIENAQFMEFDKLDPTIMEAGRNEQGQVILPMFYQLDQYMIYRETDPEDLPANWDEAIVAAQEDEYIRDVFTLALTGGYFRQLCFGKISDNVNEELIISQDELFERTKEAMELYTAGLPALLEFDAMTRDGALRACRDTWVNNIHLYGPAYTSFVPRNREGTVTAPIETWCAVNKNTKHPEDAFAIVDMFLSKEFLSQEKFWSKSTPSRTTEQTMDFFWLAGNCCVPVHTGLLSSAKGGEYKYTDTLSGDQRKVLKEARENIGCAYFPNRAEREIDQMLADLQDRVNDGEILSDEAIRKETDKCYSTMKLMLGES